MKKILIALALAPLAILSSGCSDSKNTALTIEESRIAKAQEALPHIEKRYENTLEAFYSDINETKDFEQLKKITAQHSQNLWLSVVAEMQKEPSSYDDRPLYWTRLGLTSSVKTKLSLKPQQQKELIEIIESQSRGFNDIKFRPDSDIKILITGFDPFLLDRNIKQSNPSGVAALRLDNQVIEHNGKTIEIQAAMFPVRYQDFDDGIVEKVVKPYLKNNNIDLLATISMGRENFDLEHFPGRRRSASAPDNNNLYSGGSAENPVIPKLGEKPLQGPEFVEFSLPYQAMMQAKGSYKINDNREVTTLEKTFKPNNLEELNGAVAVEGGGGGYLSNEISYRTVNLGNKLETTVPTGHIHTPRIKEFDKEVIAAIVQQIREMLVLGVTNP